jgi:hypothetical protein
MAAMNSTPPNAIVEATASWYRPDHHNTLMAKNTFADRTLPPGTKIRIVNPDSGKSAAGIVNDRGPYVSGRDADVFAAMAEQLGFAEKGIGRLDGETVSEIIPRDLSWGSGAKKENGVLLSRIEDYPQPAAESFNMGGWTNRARGRRRSRIMERVGKGEIFGIPGSYGDNRVGLAPLGPVQGIGAALAFVVVILAWAINKIFGRDLM